MIGFLLTVAYILTGTLLVLITERNGGINGQSVDWFDCLFICVFWPPLLLAVIVEQLAWINKRNYDD